MSLVFLWSRAGKALELMCDSQLQWREIMNFEGIWFAFNCLCFKIWRFCINQHSPGQFPSKHRSNWTLSTFCSVCETTQNSSFGIGRDVKRRLVSLIVRHVLWAECIATPSVPTLQGTNVVNILGGMKINTPVCVCSVALVTLVTFSKPWLPPAHFSPGFTTKYLDWLFGTYRPTRIPAFVHKKTPF